MGRPFAESAGSERGGCWRKGPGVALVGVSWRVPWAGIDGVRARRGWPQIRQGLPGTAHGSYVVGRPKPVGRAA